MGYSHKAITGVSWMAAMRAGIRIVTIGRVAILARLLSPAQFGIFGIGTIVLEFLEKLTESGINVFLVQNEGELNDYVDTAWVVSIFRGLIIACAIAILAPFIAIFFNSPLSTDLILLMAIVPIARGFINPSEVRFQKELQFSREFIFRIAIFIIDSLVAIGVSVATHSAAGLAWGMIAGAIAEVIMSHLLLTPKPRFRLDGVKVGKIVDRGKWMTMAGIFNYFYHHGDDVAVGHFMDIGSLGLYQMAYKLSILPITEIGEAISRVAFPIFSSIAHDKRRLLRAYLLSTLGISLLTIPVGLTLFMYPREILLFAFGSNWVGAADALRILAVFGAVRTIAGFPSAVFLAVKKQEYVTILTFVSILGLAVSIIPLINRYGIIGAAISALIGTLVAIPPTAICLYKTLKFDVSKTKP